VLKITHKEIWRPIKGLEKLYEVSTLGRIKNTRGKVLKTFVNNNGYECIKFSVNNVGYHKTVHRIMAEVFLIPTSILHAEVNHRNGDKLCNHILNLEWMSSSDNKLHAFKLGLRTKESCVSTLGTKHKSISSKYYNVSWDKARNKWIGSIRHNGKTHHQKRFTSEREAALHVNSIIDLLGLTDRPKNIV
jgi:hypothetical protein